MSREELATEIASLSKLDIDELQERWKAIYGRAPTGEIGRSFLTRSISYRLQERVYGGLKPSICRQLAHAVEESATETSKGAQTRTAQSDTILIRESQGTAHRVTMLDDEVSVNEKRYRSLSETNAAFKDDYPMFGPIPLADQDGARFELAQRRGLDRFAWRASSAMRCSNRRVAGFSPPSTSSCIR
jgi:hypothetical protein